MSSSAGSIQLAPNETGPTPQDYVVPGAQVFDLLAVLATFDGSGAAAEFVPAVEIISPGGERMVTALGAAIAAGSAEDVSFFPFSRASGGGGGGAFVVREGGYSGGAVPIGAFSNVAVDWSHSGGDAVLDLTNPAAPKPLFDGFYIVTLHVSMVAGVLGAGDRWAVLLSTNGVTSSDVLTTSPQGDAGYETTFGGTWNIVAGLSFYIQAFNSTAGAITLDISGIRVVAVSSS